MRPYVFVCVPVGLLLSAATGLPTDDPGKKADPVRIAALIRQLGDLKYAKREAASRELQAIGEPAWYPLRKAATGNGDGETRRRARQLAEAIGKRLFGEIRHFGGQGGYWLNRVAFTPDGRRAVATGGAVIFYDLDTGKELFRTLELSFARPGLAISQDGRFFLTGHQNDWLVRLGDLNTGKEVRRLQGHNGGVFGVALSADGKRAVSGSADRTVRLWDMQTGKALHTIKTVSGVRCVVFSPAITGRSAKTWCVSGTLPVAKRSGVFQGTRAM
jgi:WD domain, G-beta repeat